MRSLAALVLLLAGSAHADHPKKTPRPKPAPAAPQSDTATVAVTPGATHAEGEYGGVEPGHGAPKHMKAPPKGTLAWVGFEAKGGSTELFFQSIAAFEVTQHLDGNTLVVDLGGLTKLGQNTWRQLDTRFFDTPISKIVAGYGKSRAIEVRVTFKNPKEAAQAQMRTATEGDGYFYAYLTFGGGGAPSAQNPEK
jgi:hypothetical protein